jgi:hypothetical protein
MSTISEKTFGARLNNAFTIATVISNLPTYSTDLQELQPINFTAFLNAVAAINIQRTDAKLAYTNAVAERQNVFRKDDLSITKLLVPIKASVEARYGKKSTEFKQTTTAIKKMRSAKPVEYNKKDIDDPNINIVVKVSQSHLSFGSITEAFTDLVQNIQGFPNYDSPRPELTINALQGKVAQLNALNRTVDATITNYKLQQKARIDNYALLFDRANKIKALLLSLYGKNSVEYTSVAKLTV